MTDAPHLLPLLPPLPDPVGTDNGYDWIELLVLSGWREVAGLGGGLLGDWPEEVVAVHSDRRRGVYGLAVYLCGDITIRAFADPGSRLAAARGHLRPDS
ncbi:hypothetical protein [Streptacidiphilus sp. EB103A]|uniref:hypothetical protein n=1 Tax=Streptacidiphilus sp. EB103A TaxID=3156275 RepID=UPI003519D317